MADGIDEYLLSKATLSRIVKKGLLKEHLIQNDAKLALQRSATVFVSYLTAAANDITLGNNRKTILAKDVMQALNLLQLDSIVPQVEEKLHELQEKTANNVKKTKTSDDNRQESEEHQVIKEESTDTSGVETQSDNEDSESENATDGPDISDHGNESDQSTQLQ